MKNKLCLSLSLCGLMMLSTVATAKDIGAGFDLSGDYRFRYETEKNRTGSNTDWNRYGETYFDGYLQSRFRLSIAKEISDTSEVKVTLQDARTAGNSDFFGQDDELGVYEAYLHQGLTDMISLKIGRQALDYGKGRFLSANDYNNNGLVFEGAKIGRAHV